MIGLFDVLRHINPAVTFRNVNVGSPNGCEEIVEWDDSLGPQPTLEQIDAARPLAEAARIMAAIRAERDRRIAATDYMSMPDYPPAKKPAGLDVYREGLRDFPGTVDPAALPWPLDVAALNWPVLP